MSTAFSLGMPFHGGEEKMRDIMRVPSGDNPTSTMLTPQLANSLQNAPLIAVGTLDSEQRPWTTIWGGHEGLSQALGNSIIGMKTIVDRKYDPVVEALFGKDSDGELVKEEQPGRMLSGLTVHLVPRKRVKFFGRMVAAAAAPITSDGDTLDVGQAKVQIVARIDQSLGNCPKYLNCKVVHPSAEEPELASETSILTQEGQDLVTATDVFFVSSSNSTYDMDTNHRGGPPGFVRVQTNKTGQSEIIWPEYSGNRLYQTLGNLQVTPRAGLVFPDFEKGNVLYVTGSTEIFAGKEASAIMPRSNLIVKLVVETARFVRSGLPFRGELGERSPYNPMVRLLASEQLKDVPNDSSTEIATLISSERLTPTISRYRFKTGGSARYTAGQWVALDFSTELDTGYSHMRDDDPRSLNDDFVRTFTVSSPPSSLPANEFEITIRRVGTVTEFLAKQRIASPPDITIRGFGGDFRITQNSQLEKMPYVAGGVGITPLLAAMPELDLSKLTLFWTLRFDDIDLALELLRKRPQLGPVLHLFFTRSSPNPEEDQAAAFKFIRDTGSSYEMRRLGREDLDIEGLASTWYLCCSVPLRKQLQDWLPGRDLVFEDFNF